MKISQLVKLLSPSRLSPEELAPKLGISSMTYRRWLRTPAEKKLPAKYDTSVRQGVCELIADGKLDPHSPPVIQFVTQNSPYFFQAAIRNLGLPAGFETLGVNHEDQVTLGLTHIGSNAAKQKEVNESVSQIKGFEKFGQEWKKRIKTLVGVIRSRKLTMVDKLVAYGALFYLITPFDLIPDNIPIFGYLDDYAILGFAMAYYFKKFPGTIPESRV